MSTYEHRTALEAGKSVLYKFKTYDGTKVNQEQIREIITGNKLYFARRDELNDPFDMFPMIQYSSEFESSAAALRIHVQKHFLVFSLSGKRDHPLLWSHYAGGHTGLCIHFRSDDSSPFGKAREVHYREDRQVLRVPFSVDVDEEEVIQRMALSKGSFWSYENEYRLIATGLRTGDRLPLLLEDQKATIAGHWLCGITLGACMPLLLQAELIATAQAAVPTLPVWQARPYDGDHYGLSFQRIA
jgi:hypothetical protein